MKKYFLTIFLFSLFLIILSLNKDYKKSNIIFDNFSIETYFCPEDICKDILINYIKNSQEIKCAFYELNLIDVINELKKKNSEIIIEDSTFEKNYNLYFNFENIINNKKNTNNNLNNSTIYNNIIQNNINNNFTFTTSYSKALMHNKFCIFDKKVVFTGSMNPTFNDNYLNDNNILIIKSEKISNLYLYEFDEIKNNLYGKGKKSKNNIIYKNINTDNNLKNIFFNSYNNKNQTRIEIYFCPEDNCQSQVIKEIEKANYSIYFYTFSFTDFKIATKILEKVKKNITIKGIYDQSQISNYSTYNILKNYSILDKNLYKMHNKVFIIDNKTIITGSYNPSKNANLFNDENLIIIENHDITKKYLKKFIQLYNQKNISLIIKNQESCKIIKYNNITNNQNNKDIYILSILPNPKGLDKDKEYIEIYNPTNKTIDLGYYKITDGKKIMILKNKIDKNSSLKIKPSFTLPNKKGIIYFIKLNEIIDCLDWSFENKI